MAIEKLCDELCTTCAYACTITGGALVCDYLLVTGIMRGCPAGTGCDKYLPGEKIRSLSSQIQCGKLDDLTGQKRKEARRAETQRRLGGRQRAAIRDYCRDHGVAYVDIARAIGVSQSTIAYWAKEYGMARWDKLAKVGIKRPEGI